MRSPRVDFQLRRCTPRCVFMVVLKRVCEVGRESLRARARAREKFDSERERAIENVSGFRWLSSSQVRKPNEDDDGFVNLVTSMLRLGFAI